MNADEHVRANWTHVVLVGLLELDTAPARLLHVMGVLERQGDIVHVMAGRLSDLSHLIQSLPVNSRNFH